MKTMFLVNNIDRPEPALDHVNFKNWEYCYMDSIPNTPNDTNVVLPLFEASNITSSEHFQNSATMKEWMWLHN